MSSGKLCACGQPRGLCGGCWLDCGPHRSFIGLVAGLVEKTEEGSTTDVTSQDQDRAPNALVPAGYAPLQLRPITLKKALAYVRERHRHSVAPRGGVFCASAWSTERLCGVGIAGRPVARMLQDGLTLEITRVCTDGTPNACSLLYGALVRAGRALGYTRFVTYTRADEPGTSLRAAGWQPAAQVRRESWDRPSRPRDDRDERVARVRWELQSRKAS